MGAEDPLEAQKMLADYFREYSLWIPSYICWIGLNTTTTDGRDGLGGIHASVRLPQPTHTLAHTDPF